MKRRLKNGVAVALILQTGVLFAEASQWWLDRGVINTNLTPNDYAPVNQGQVKQIVYKAHLEFGQKLGGTSSAISNLVAGFSATNNYLPVNLGQLKAVAAPFYDQLVSYGLTNAWPVGMTTGPYPWSSSTNPAHDYAIANIGQLKYLLSFDFGVRAGLCDTDQDGLPDWLETFNGWAPDNSDTDGDGLPDVVELNVYRTDPNNADVAPPAVCIVTPANRVVVIP